MQMKSHILAALREQFDRWDALLVSLSEPQITSQRVLGDWSVKDNIAHLRAWQQRSIARLEAAHLNQEPAFPTWLPDADPDVDANTEQINAWIYHTYRDQPWSTVYQDWRTGYLRFLELGQAITERDLLDSGKYSWLAGHELAS